MRKQLQEVGTFDFSPKNFSPTICGRHSRSVESSAPTILWKK